MVKNLQIFLLGIILMEKKQKETRKIYRDGDKYVEIVSMPNGKIKIKGNRELVNKVKKL